jgi:lipopolysaccharide/colanic/teichoic acid biosynthesis glycosyltransferase
MVLFFLENAVMVRVRNSFARLRQARGGSSMARDEGARKAPPRPIAEAPGRMTPRKHKLLILLLVQAVFFTLLLCAARIAAGALYPRDNLFSYRLVLPMVVFFFSYFLLVWRSLYSRDYHYYFRRGHRTVLKSAPLPIALACACFLLLGGGTHEPAVLMLIFLAAGFVSFPVADGCQHLWIGYLCRLGYFQRKLLIIGRLGLRHSIDVRVRDFGITKICAGEIDRSDGVWLWRPAGGGSAKVVKHFAQIRTIILKENIGDVLVFPGGSADRAFERDLIAYCQSQSISYSLVPRRAGTRQTGIASLLFPNIPASERFAGPRDSLTAVSAKRILDVAISAFCLIVFLPAGLLITLAILIQDGSPVFYVSSRIGKNGRPIRFLKFRTMRRGAENEKEKLLAFNTRRDGPLFKMKNDPRVTAIGGFLRRYSLDEFPQFLNVLLGTLSLVGPRPHLPEEVAQYREGDYLRLECMPGIVGLPQVSGRSTSIGFREWVDLDLFYRSRWSLALDVGIMMKTVSMFFRSLFAGPSPDHY